MSTAVAELTAAFCRELTCPWACVLAASKIRETRSYITGRGLDEARRTTASLAPTWRKPESHVDMPRLHMQTPSVAIESVMLDKLSQASGELHPTVPPGYPYLPPPPEWELASSQNDEHTARDEVQPPSNRRLGAVW